MIIHSTPKPPPGIPHRSISNSPFFVPKLPPGFEIAATFHHSDDKTINVSPKPDTMKSGEISPSFSSVSNTELGPLTPVSQTDKDSHQFSAVPSKSITGSHTDSVATEVSSVSSKITIQSLETGKLSHSHDSSNQSVNTFHPMSVPSVSCQSVTNHCDSGIISMLDQTSQLLSPVHTHSSFFDKGIDVKENLGHHCTQITSTGTSVSYQIETEKDSSNEINTSSQSRKVNSSDSNNTTYTSDLTPPLASLSNVTSVEEQHTVLNHTAEICRETFTALTGIVPCGYSEQSAVSPVKLFDEVMQTEGHKEYGKLHPVRRPWQLIYNTLRWLKPFK